MATLQAETARPITPAELAAMRARGVISPEEPVELIDGRLTIAGRLRPIWPDEAVRMVETDVIDPDERVELIEGELWSVSPQGTPHSWVLRNLTMILPVAYHRVAEVAVQSPTRVLGPSLPEPDLMVLRPLDSYRDVTASDLLLVIEVMVTSHSRDRRKAAIYARAGVPRLWLMDVPARSVEVFTDPRPDGTWGTRRTFGEDQPLALPGIDRTITLREVLPPQ